MRTIFRFDPDPLVLADQRARPRRRSRAALVRARGERPLRHGPHQQSRCCGDAAWLCGHCWSRGFCRPCTWRISVVAGVSQHSAAGCGSAVVDVVSRPACHPPSTRRGYPRKPTERCLFISSASPGWRTNDTGDVYPACTLRLCCHDGSIPLLVCLLLFTPPPHTHQSSPFHPGVLCRSWTQMTPNLQPWCNINRLPL